MAHPNVTVTYDAVGSGEGVKRFLAESVDFAGSDEILSESEIAKAPGTIMLPITAGMIALAYNIPGINSEIKLPRDVYVEIFAGKIRKWDDPRIQAANPGIAFPRRDIALVASQDSSGTTAAFTNHLAAMRAFYSHQATRMLPLAFASARAQSATSSIGLRSASAFEWRHYKTNQKRL